LPKSPFVLIPGAFHGGWLWARIADRLVAAGHRVFAPSLAGIGDRAAGLHGGINLSTHIEEIAALVRFEHLTDAVLVGHSYGGMIVSGVADRMPDAFRALVYCDALAPRDGDTVAELVAPERKNLFFDTASREGGWLVRPVPAQSFDIASAADRVWVDELCTPQPLATFIERIKLTGSWQTVANLIYVLGANYRSDTLKRHAAPLRGDPRWQFHELPSGHHPMLDTPEDLARILLEAA
jgi:pimeloyl-ACP methyl ester carboxylesterase